MSTTEEPSGDDVEWPDERPDPPTEPSHPDTTPDDEPEP